MSIMTVTTRITRQYLERKTKSDLAQMYLDLLDDEEDLRQRCFKDMQRFIENCRKDSTPDVPAYETLTVMLQTLNDCGSEGFGDSDWQKKPLAAGQGEQK